MRKLMIGLMVIGLAVSNPPVAYSFSTGSFLFGAIVGGAVGNSHGRSSSGNYKRLFNECQRAVDKLLRNKGRLAYNGNYTISVSKQAMERVGESCNL